MNNENLKPFNQRTESEQREIARAGGIASGEARRKNKTIRERLLLMMEEGAEGGGVTFADKVTAAILEKAAAGDLKAIRLMGEYLGEFKQKVEFEDKTPEMTIEEAEAIYKIGIERKWNELLAQIDGKDNECKPPTRLFNEAAAMLGKSPEYIASDIMNGMD